MCYRFLKDASRGFVESCFCFSCTAFAETYVSTPFLGFSDKFHFSLVTLPLLFQVQLLVSSAVAISTDIAFLLLCRVFSDLIVLL